MEAQARGTDRLDQLSLKEEEEGREREIKEGGWNKETGRNRHQPRGLE